MWHFCGMAPTDTSWSFSGPVTVGGSGGSHGLSNISNFQLKISRRSDSWQSLRFRVGQTCVEVIRSKEVASRELPLSHYLLVCSSCSVPQWHEDNPVSIVFGWNWSKKLFIKVSATLTFFCCWCNFYKCEVFFFQFFHPSVKQISVGSDLREASSEILILDYICSRRDSKP